MSGPLSLSISQICVLVRKLLLQALQKQVNATQTQSSTHHPHAASLEERDRINPTLAESMLSFLKALGQEFNTSHLQPITLHCNSTSRFQVPECNRKGAKVSSQ